MTSGGYRKKLARKCEEWGSNEEVDETRERRKNVTCDEKRRGDLTGIVLL